VHRPSLTESDYIRDLRLAEWGLTVILRRDRMSALGGGFNGSTQHLLILLEEEEVCDGGDCTNMVHAAAED
jgi:hypothetical protein